MIDFNFKKCFNYMFQKNIENEHILNINQLDFYIIFAILGL